MLANIKNSDDFYKQYDRLHDRIVADTLIKADPKIRQSILLMQSSIIANSSEGGVHTEATQDYVTNAAIKWYCSQNTENIHGMISRLVSLCNTNTNLQLARFERNYKHIENTPIANIEIVEDCEYEDPVMMDNDMPVICFADADPLFESESDEIRKDIERCPLNLLKHQHLVDKILDRIVPIHGISFLKTYESMNYDFSSPETRRPMMRQVLCMGNHPSHTKANKACIAMLLTGKMRLCGQYGLWLPTMYCILSKKQFVIDTIGKQLESFLSSFLKETPKEHMVFMGLEGSGLRPTNKTSVATALLYAVESTNIWCNEHTSRDIMRDAWPIYKDISHLLSICGIDVSKYDNRIKTIETLCKTLWYAKKNSTKKLKHKILSEFYENIIVGNTTFLTDRPKDIPGSIEFALLDGGYIDTNKRIGDIYVPLELPIARPKLSAFNEKENINNKQPIEICPLTLRPRVYGPDGTFWKDASERTFGPIEGQVSCHYNLLGFYTKYRCFPETESDLEIFISLLERAHKKGCLPSHIVPLAKECIEEIKDAFDKRKDKTYDSVVRDIKRGSPLESRIAMEKTWYH
jgi:hypothetical protein